MKMEKDVGNLKTTFAELYEANFDSLFEYGCRLHKDPHLVQDCIQDTFIKLWSGKTALSGITNIKGYLLISLKNNILNRISASRRSVNADEENSFELIYSAEDDLIQKETSAETLNNLYNALNSLTPRQKECLYLRYFEGLSYEEIAGILNISTKATYKLSARALDYLKATLPESIFLILFSGY